MKNLLTSLRGLEDKWTRLHEPRMSELQVQPADRQFGKHVVFCELLQRHGRRRVVPKAMAN